MRREFFQIAGDLLDASYRPAPEESKRVRQGLPGKTAPVPVPASRARVTPGRLRLAVCTDTPEGVREALAAGADTILFEAGVQSGRHTCGTERPARPLQSRVTEAAEICRKAGAQFVWKLPRILHDEELGRIIRETGSLPEEGLTACMSGNPGISRAIARAVPGMALWGGSGLNVFNHAAACSATPHYDLLTVSPELSRDEIAVLISSAAGCRGEPRFALTVQGSALALVTEDCIARLLLHCSPDSRGGRNATEFLGLRDETGHVFPLHAGSDCRTRIMNASELCLIDMLPAIKDCGIAEIIVDARHRPAAYAGAMTRLYREAVDSLEAGAGPSRNESLQTLKEQARGISLGGITTGHFLRGLKE
jgi:putative protease